MEETIVYLKNLLKDNDTVVIGLSGGPDSMCLLNILLSLNKKINIICAHINHNIREESKDELLFVEDYCKQKQVTIETTTFAKKSSLANYSEQELREKRYQFFEEIINKHNADYLFTAHHGDDLIETILMRLTRGSNLKGYSGFQTETPKENYKVIKPLIYATKDDIDEYNKQNNIPSVIDNTNFKDIYTRNRYRHNILPFLKSENPNIHLKYLKFSKELNKYYEFVNTLINKELSKRYKDNILDITNYNELEPLFQTKLIENVLDSIYIDNLYLITDRHVELILGIINNPRPNLEINLPADVRVVKSYNQLIITKNNKKISDYNILLKEINAIPNGREIRIINNTTEKSNYYLKLNSKEITLPLYVRNRKTGDKMIIKNMNNAKKIKDIFIDEKIPKEERDTYPIVVDKNDNILWIPGIKKSKFDKSNDENYDIILWYN
ncbi:MAG: tRNA lysidine(34) synthetase TilS [Candidatus Coprovivens sp.]